MQPSRRVVLAVALVAVATVTVVILKGVLGTIFFAVTVAYVLLPLTDRLAARGMPPRWRAATATVAALVAGLGLFLPIGVVLYTRRRAALALLRSLPDSVTVSFEEFTYVVDAGEVTALAARSLTRLALGLAQGMPVAAVKVVVFAFVLFALLYRGDQLRRAVQTPVPDEYHDELYRFHERVRETLYSLYVIQATTAVATFAIALVVFLALGLRYPVTLAVLAGLFQFLPVIGPSVVVAGLVVADLVAGDVSGALVVGVVGLVLIAFLPDAVLRPWLAQETARLPSALYFVGLTGGLLSLGPVGVVAGPLVVALLLEVLALLAEESPAGG